MIVDSGLLFWATLYMQGTCREMKEPSSSMVTLLTYHHGKAHAQRFHRHGKHCGDAEAEKVIVGLKKKHLYSAYSVLVHRGVWRRTD